VANCCSTAHVHFQDGKHITGIIQQHKCSAEIIIFSPIDPTICKAIVVTAPGIPHNYPPCPLEKWTYVAMELYMEAVGQVGIISVPVGQIDQGESLKSFITYPAWFSHFCSQQQL